MLLKTWLGLVHKLKLLFFVALFIYISNSAHAYSCIGTSGKNSQNPHEMVLVKNHFRGYLIGTLCHLWRRVPSIVPPQWPAKIHLFNFFYGPSMHLRKLIFLIWVCWRIFWPKLTYFPLCKKISLPVPQVLITGWKPVLLSWFFAQVLETVENLSC